MTLPRQTSTKEVVDACPEKQTGLDVVRNETDLLEHGKTAEEKETVSV